MSNINRIGKPCADISTSQELISQRQALQRLGIGHGSFKKVAEAHGIAYYTRPPLKTFYVSAADVDRVLQEWSRQAGAGAAANGR